MGVDVQEHDALPGDESNRAITLVDPDRLDTTVSGALHALEIQAVG
jgi:hypothetical protein